MLTVEDDELIGAFLDMVENHKMIVENSGLLTVAALRQLDLKGKKAVSILSGGNMDVITMSSIVQHGLIQRDRIFSVSVLLPDKPGELVRVAQTIADAQATLSSWITISLSAPTGMRLWSFVSPWSLWHRTQARNYESAGRSKLPPERGWRKALLKD